MKKFLVILMVVAMASVLFVGCTTPPTPDPDPDPTPTPVVVLSATPVLTAVETSAAVSIFDVTSTSTLYMNAAEAGSSILVKGTAPAESVVKIYLGDVALISVAETAVTGLWTIAIAESSLGADGVKVMTAKVTEVGLAESVASNSVTFTLDTVLPSATTLAATGDAIVGFTGGTCVETGTAATEVVTTSGDVVTGTWVIDILGITGVAANVSITNPAGTVLTYTQVAGGAIFLPDAPIPGVTITLVNPIAAGQQSTIVCLAESAAIADRARVLFSEEITNASAISLANYTFTDGGVATVPAAVSYSAKYMYFSTFAPLITLGDALGCSVNGVIDLAGNIQTTASVITATVAAPSLTTLAP